jgi:hypothetical protein
MHVSIETPRWSTAGFMDHAEIQGTLAISDLPEGLPEAIYPLICQGINTLANLPCGPKGFAITVLEEIKVSILF